MYNEMEYQEEYRMADLIRRQWLGIITAEEQAELEAWSLQEEHARLYAKIRNQTELQKRNLYVDGLDVDGVWHKLREQIADVPELPFLGTEGNQDGTGGENRGVGRETVAQGTQAGGERDDGLPPLYGAGVYGTEVYRSLL